MVLLLHDRVAERRRESVRRRRLTLERLVDLPEPGRATGGARTPYQFFVERPADSTAPGRGDYPNLEESQLQVVLDREAQLGGSYERAGVPRDQQRAAKVRARSPGQLQQLRKRAQDRLRMVDAIGRLLDVVVIAEAGVVLRVELGDLHHGTQPTGPRPVGPLL